MRREKCAPEDLRGEIERFLKSCREPAWLEPGEEPIPLTPGCFELVCRGGRLMMEAWDRERNLSRRVLGAARPARGRIKVVTERFGKKRGSAQIIDQQNPGTETALKQGRRHVFRERFRQFLRRQFPGWKLQGLTTEADLERSLSPSYPRALVSRGQTGWAAIGAEGQSDHTSAVLSFGLIWLDLLRRRETGLAIEGLIILLPAGQQSTTCLRLRFLDPGLARFVVFVYSPDGDEERIDPSDHGNLDTRLSPFHSGVPDAGWALGSDERLASIPGLQIIPGPGGARSYRVNGLEFAQRKHGRLSAGIVQRRAMPGSDGRELVPLAAELARMRSANARDRTNPLYTRFPESWLEAQVRRSPQTLDAGLRPEPIYGQVPAFSAGKRGVLDLLGVDRAGRLAVLELKAGEDPHLPLQALDYWMRVRHHAQNGDFTDRGYFPGIELSPLPPTLYLVAPALEFHPSTETILRFFDRTIPVHRIGVGSAWRRELRIVLRARGAENPGM